MDFRLGLVMLLFLGVNFCEARNLIQSDDSGSIHQNGEKGAADAYPDCTLCIDYANLVLKYIKENRTETEILASLRYDCTQSQTSEYEVQRCFILVDAYTKVYMDEYTTVKPAAFCADINLCAPTTTTTVSLPKAEKSRGVIYQTINLFLLELKDRAGTAKLIENKLLDQANGLELGKN